jgi:Na+-driven multidrug efflux pump
VAGSGVGSRLEQFAHLPAFSVGLAVTALVGQNLGAGQKERVSEVVKWGMLLTCTITGAITLVVQAFPTAVLSLFTKDPQVLAAGTVYLRWISLGFVPFAAMFALTGVLRGAGDTLPTFFITLGSLWLVRVPLVRVLARTSLGVEGAWMAMASGPFVGLLLSYAYYRSGRWKQKAIVSRRPAAGSADLVTTDDIQ